MAVRGSPGRGKNGTVALRYSACYRGLSGGSPPHPFLESNMIKHRARAIGAFVGVALAIAPLSSAFAADKHYRGGYSHGYSGRSYGGHGGHGYGGHYGRGYGRP